MRLDAAEEEEEEEEVESSSATRASERNEMLNWMGGETASRRSTRLSDESEVAGG